MRLSKGLIKKSEILQANRSIKEEKIKTGTHEMAEFSLYLLKSPTQSLF